MDDAIVVVENVERNMRLGMSSREAAHRTMDEVSGALIAIALYPMRCVHPDGLHFWHLGAVFPAVRDHHCGFYDHLVLRLTHLEPGAVRFILLKPHKTDHLRSAAQHSSHRAAGIRSI